MKNVLSITVFVLVCLLLWPAQVNAQTDIAWAYEMKPKMGHASQLEEAVGAHAKWRQDHGDPWTWNVFEVITGTDVGSLGARSGMHTWADLDAYAMWEHSDAADRHFEATVVPHLEELRSVISQGNTELVRWPENPEDSRVMMVVAANLNNGMGSKINEVLSAYHKTIVEHDFDTHYYFAYGVSGADYDMVMVFPEGSMAGFATPSETLDKLMIEVHGQEKYDEMQEIWNASIKDAESFMIVARPDLSVMGAGSN